MKMQLNLKPGVCALALAGLCGAAQATPLAINQTVSPVDILAAAPGGTLLGQVITPISTPTFSGTLRTAVYDGPEAGANMDFYYQFSSDSTSLDSIGRVTGTNFGAWTTNVFQTAAAFGAFLAGGQQALNADRGPTTVGFDMEPSSYGNGEYNTFSVDPNGKLDPGETSYTFLVRTDAPAFTSGFAGVIDGTAAYSVAFQPAVPEPGTNALIAAGLGLMAFVVRRRRRGGVS